MASTRYGGGRAVLRWPWAGAALAMDQHEPISALQQRSASGATSMMSQSRDAFLNSPKQYRVASQLTQDPEKGLSLFSARPPPTRERNRSTCYTAMALDFHRPRTCLKAKRKEANTVGCQMAWATLPIFPMACYDIFSAATLYTRCLT